MELRRPAVRVVLGGLAVALATVGLTGCRTDPNVAAYVGDDAISVRQLDDAVAARESAPEMASFVAAHRDTYPRTVLGLLVTQQVYADAQQHFGVQVSDDAVRADIARRLAGRDPAQLYTSAAAQGFSRQDVFEVLRQQLVLRQIAHAQKLDGALSEASLRTAYQQQLPSLSQTQLGAISTPDQATADGVIAQLQQDPGSYAAVAAAHAGPGTEAALQAYPVAQLNPDIQAKVTAAAPNTAFSVPESSGGVGVVFVGPTTTPSFEEARPQLEAAVSGSVDAAAQKVVDSYRSGLSLQVNPRYGVLGTDGKLADPSGGVVQLLDGAAPAGAAAGTDPATSSGTAGG